MRCRRSVLWPFPLLLLVIGSLAGCGPGLASPAALATAATATALPATAAASSSATSTSLPSPTPSTTSTPILTPTPRPTSTPVPTATPTPSLSPVRTPIPGDALSLSLDWRFDANGHLTAASVIRLEGQPRFLLASLGRTVYALTGAGQVAWRARTAGPVYALALLKDGRVAVGDDAGAITLLDAGGNQLWQRHLGSRVTALLGGWQGGLLAGGWDEQLTFLGPQGEIQWTAGLDGPLSGITSLPGVAVAATLAGEIRAFGPAGAEVWRFDAGAPITALDVMAEGVDPDLLIGLQNGQMLALDAEGTLRWQLSLGTGSPVWHLANLSGDPAPEIIAGMGDPPQLILLSGKGQVLWRLAVPSPVGAVTSLDLDGDGTLEILAGLASGQVQAYDGLGRLRTSIHAGLPVWGLETTGAGEVLVRADVVAWRLVGEDGATGGAWLPPPRMVAALPPALPPGTERAEGEAILVFLGDVSPGRSMEAQLVRFGPVYPWTGLESLLQEADLAVANLEGVLTTKGEPLDKSYLIRAHPRWGQTLVEAGFDLVTLANNHALDYGPAGLEETLHTLVALDIAAVGAGASQEAAHRPALFNFDGVRVAVLGYAAARWNGSVDVPATDRLAWAEPELIRADVGAAGQQADVVIVLLHAGTEYAAEPSPDQVAAARAAVEAGADLVVGHHPHVTQTVERYEGGLVVYSLGDALFDIPRPAAMTGHLLRVHVTREGLAQAELWPFWIEDAIRPRLLADAQGRPQVQIVLPLAPLRPETRPIPCRLAPSSLRPRPVARKGAAAARKGQDGKQDLPVRMRSNWQAMLGAMRGTRTTGPHTHVARPSTGLQPPGCLLQRRQDQQAQDGIQDQAHQEEDAKPSRKSKGRSHKPQGPDLGGIRLGPLLRPGVPVHGQDHPQEHGQREEHDQHHRREKAGDHQESHQDVLQHNQEQGRGSGQALAQENGQGADVLDRVRIQLVNVLAHKRGGDAQRVGKTGKGYLPVPDPGEDIVATPDHERSPHQQQRHFPQAKVLERIGVEQDKEGAHRHQDQGRPSSVPHQGGPRCDCDQARDGSIGQKLPLAHQSVLQRLRAVLGAKVVPLVHPPRIVGVVIQQVVGAMGHDQTQCKQQPYPHIESTRLQRQDARNGRRYEGQDQRHGAGGDEPPRHQIQAIPFFLADARHTLQCLDPHGKVDFHESSLQAPVCRLADTPGPILCLGAGAKPPTASIAGRR
jgi:poly-gamma-glutamate capsule biosynthesis protein CapA/YwtB (metallophosphatase superfamily)